MDPIATCFAGWASIVLLGASALLAGSAAHVYLQAVALLRRAERFESARRALLIAALADVDRVRPPRPPSTPRAAP